MDVGEQQSALLANAEKQTVLLEDIRRAARFIAVLLLLGVVLSLVAVG